MGDFEHKMKKRKASGILSTGTVEMLDGILKSLLLCDLKNLRSINVSVISKKVDGTYLLGYQYAAPYGLLYRRILPALF